MVCHFVRYPVYSEFVCSLPYLVRMRMRGIPLSSVTCLTRSYFYTLSHKLNDFRTKTFTEHETYFDFLYKFYVKYFYF